MKIQRLLDDNYTRLYDLLDYVALVIIGILTDSMLVTGSLLHFIMYMAHTHLWYKGFEKGFML